MSLQELGEARVPVREGTALGTSPVLVYVLTFRLVLVCLDPCTHKHCECVYSHMYYDSRVYMPVWHMLFTCIYIS